MIPKSGNRFSEKIMLKKSRWSRWNYGGVEIVRKV